MDPIEDLDLFENDFGEWLAKHGCKLEVEKTEVKGSKLPHYRIFAPVVDVNKLKSAIGSLGMVLR